MADANKSQRWPNLEGKAHPEVISAIRLLYNAIDNHEQAFQAQSQRASLVATISGGAVTAVNVVAPGQYSAVPKVTAVGGGGSGAAFSVQLNQTGGIRSVTVTSGGTGYNSAPALTVS